MVAVLIKTNILQSIQVPESRMKQNYVLKLRPDLNLSLFQHDSPRLSDKKRISTKYAFSRFRISKLHLDIHCTSEAFLSKFTSVNYKNSFFKAQYMKCCKVFVR